MGNLCSCCLKAEPDGNEAPPVETTELLPSRSRPTEREVKSYDSILENASSTFLAFKGRGRSGTNNNEAPNQKLISNIRTRLQEATVPASLAQSPPSSTSSRDLWHTNSSSQASNGQAFSAQQSSGGVNVDSAFQQIVGALNKPFDYDAIDTSDSIVKFLHSEEEGQG